MKDMWNKLEIKKQIKIRIKDLNEKILFVKYGFKVCVCVCVVLVLHYITD
jgi:hypothetical protein